MVDHQPANQNTASLVSATIFTILKFLFPTKGRAGEAWGLSNK
jgi:hypothetical protein